MNLDATNERLKSRFVQYIANNSILTRLKTYLIKRFEPSNLLINNELIDCFEAYAVVLPSGVI